MLTVEGCTFKANGLADYNGINIWGESYLKDCSFIFDGSCSTEWIDPKKASVFENCTINGEPISLEKHKETYIKNANNITFK